MNSNQRTTPTLTNIYNIVKFTLIKWNNATNQGKLYFDSELSGSEDSQNSMN